MAQSTIRDFKESFYRLSFGHHKLLLLLKKVKVIAPLNESDKVGNIKKGIELDLPFEYTWTCVARDDVACGICQPCRDRLQAFEKAGIPDPIKYANNNIKEDKND